jgi:Tannase and feruloyl esterase/3HB-oligomer hydrolase (3HBOH)
MRTSVRLALLAPALGLALLPLLASGPATAAGGHCAVAAAIDVPGAEQQDAPDCLADLTTPGLVLTGNTDASDWATLTSVRTKLQAKTPGIQVDGYFPDDSKTNGSSGKNHDSQFVMRFPDTWNGGLFITGAPGVRKQYAVDRAISDWAVAHHYAYASTDKGNTGNAFYNNGPSRTRPGDAVLEWHERVTQLTVAAKATAAQVYGTAPRRTYMTGISNGGYLTRWAIEHHPELYDGAVDWEGTLFRPDVNLFTYLPVALKNYPKYAATHDKAAHDAMIAAGFEPGSESLWPEHYAIYWDLTQRVYREEFDPSYDGALEAGVPFCQAGLGIPGCDADYDYATRPAAVHDAISRVSLAGRIGKPMLTLHGTLDSLLPIDTDSDRYDKLVDGAGKGALHRYYVVEDGNHVDSFADSNPDTRPILPCYYEALDAMVAWVEKGTAPPPDGLIARPTSGDEANECALPASKVTPSSSATPSATPSSGSGSGSTASPRPRPTAVAGAPIPSTGSGGSLAATGGAPLLAGLGVLVLLGGALGLRAARRTR